MKSISQYITEFVNINNIKIYKYHPKTKEELIENIKIELDKGNTDLNCIDTSNITDMRELFNQYYSIALTDEQQKTLDVSEWNVSKVENMKCMFWGCKQFNCDLSKWNVSNVKTMYCMFRNCEQFNCDLLKWDVSSVEKMHGMFYHCQRFNCDLSKWDVSNVINMSNMFYKSGLDGHEPSWYKK